MGITECSIVLNVLITILNTYNRNVWLKLIQNNYGEIKQVWICDLNESQE